MSIPAGWRGRYAPRDPLTEDRRRFDFDQLQRDANAALERQSAQCTAANSGLIGQALAQAGRHLLDRSKP